MRIVFLTRTERPSGAIVAKEILSIGKNLVGIVAERRREMIISRTKGTISAIRGIIKDHGFTFFISRVSERINIKIHLYLRFLLPKKLYRSKAYYSIEELHLDYPAIPYYAVDNHNSASSRDIIRKLNPDIIALTNTRVISKEIINVPGNGCINLHLSKLPEYAGLASIFLALYNGEKEIGVTVHFVDEKVDRGDVILQRCLKVCPGDTEKGLYEKAVTLGSKMMVEAITQIEEGLVKRIPQDVRLASYYSWPTRRQRTILKRLLRRRRYGESGVKVLHVITRLVKGGAQENTLLTLLGLRDKGYNVTLISGPTYGPEGTIETRVRREGLRLIIIPELIREINIVKDIISLWKLYRLIKRERYDIVHTHTSKAGIIGRLAAKAAGVPIIIHTPHGHVFHSYFGFFKTRFFLFLEKFSAYLTDRIINLTYRCKEDHIKLGIAPPHKFQVIHSGVEEEKFLNVRTDGGRLREELGLPLEARIVGTVSRLVPVKGIHFFVNAIPEVLRDFPDTYFLIVGDGWMKSELERMVRDLRLHNKVVFSGIKDDIPQVISVMDVFVLPSLNEGMGRVLVEAGLMAKPLIATATGGIPELIENNRTGILVQPGDHYNLARGINSMLSNLEKARTMGQAAKIQMLSRFSAQAMVDEIVKLYQEV